MKGIIALDIDGTITVDEHRLEFPVKKYLEDLIDQNWKVILITGRTFAFSKPILKMIEKPFVCAVQNGAILLELPQEKIIKKNVLPIEIISKVEPIFSREQTGFLVESGIENNDQCFFRWQDFPEKMYDYLRYRISISPEKWVEVQNFNTIPIQSFATIKYFAPLEQAHDIAKKIETQLGDFVKVTVIRDPFNQGSYLAHINQKQASKGKALHFFIGEGKKMPVIVAGDDYNDLEMLTEGDVKIVMENAPKDILKLADIVAPSAKKMGIIEGINQAIKKVSS